MAIAAAGSGLFYGSSNPDSSELYVQFFFFNVCILRFKLTEASELERFFAQNDFFLSVSTLQHFRGLCLNSIMIIIFEL